ncbi:MAG: cadmium-translocating P-type ATPase [Phycisphaerae bacterium]|nr:cadmium-translocating P-type ATPase [Phycisphaerae bacterium]
MPGVDGLSFDLFNRRLTVEHTLESDDSIVAALKGIGMPPDFPQGADQQRSAHSGRSHAHGEAGHTHDEAAGESDGSDDKERRGAGGRWVATRTQITLLGLSGALAFGAEIVAWTTKTERSPAIIALAVVSVLLGGLPVLRKGLIALKTFTLNINFLMTVAVIGAAAIGSWPEAAMVLFLFAVAELIEAYSLERARNAVRSLMTLTPDTASVKSGDGSWAEVAAAEVAVGSTVRVKPGERIPLDGTITSGASAVDQAPITGESIPVEKAVGDTVFAGTINGNGLLEFTTTGGRDDTTLARIIKTVQEAQGQRAPTQRFVDSFARVYTPIVCGLALLVTVVPPLAFQQEWMPWVYKALVLLVVGCPCALVISTPVTIVSGLAAAAKRGILIKGGVYLEQGKTIKLVALDKTGTITEGKPKVTEVRELDSHSTDQILRLAASLDAGSDHPVARAVSAAWDGAKVAAGGPLLRVENLASFPGRGVSGTIDGKAYFVGNHRFGHERGVCSPTVEAVLGELEAKGQTTVVLTDETAALGVLAVADTPRESSVQALRELHALGVRTVMLSGDNQTTAEVIARSVGIDDARGGLLPEDKLTAIKELLAKHGAVGMVGDGVNDAPALAEATVGFAMGAAGTDTALETADVALMKDDLRGVPEFLALSRRTSAILVQNISFALGAKAVFFTLAVVGVATMWMAVLADVGATLLVIGNGLRVMRR